MIKTNELRIYISSPPDRDNLVADIFFGNEQFAELNQEDGTLRLEVYPRQNGEFWQLRLDEVLVALNDARNRLIGE